MKKKRQYERKIRMYERCGKYLHSAVPIDTNFHVRILTYILK